MTVTYKLAERNKQLYVIERFYQDDQPIAVNNWFALNVSWDLFHTWFPSDAIAREQLGRPLYPMNSNPVNAWKSERGIEYRLPRGWRVAAFAEQETIPEPKQTGRKYKLIWKNGAWYRKDKQRGFVRVADASEVQA